MTAAASETYVIVGQSIGSDGLSERTGQWYSDGVRYATVREASAAKARKLARERKAGTIGSSRGGHIFRGYRFRIWTADEYRTFERTGRAPFLGGI